MERLISAIAPGWALKRAKARLQLARMQAFYESAKHSRTHPLKGTNSSADSVMARTDGRLRNIARWLDENHDLAVALFNDLVGWIIGDGLTYEPMVRQPNGELAERVNLALGAAFESWSERPETTATLSRGEMERLLCRSWLRDGEALIHHVFGSTFPYPTPLRYVVELLEADFLPYELTAPARQGVPRIVQGVGLDSWNRPVSYYLWTHHPGASGYFLASSLKPERYKSVPAERISHLKFTRRLAQTRGVPIIHAVIRRLEDIKDIEDAERVAMRVDSDLTLILTNMPGWGGTPAADSGGGAGDPQGPIREMTMASGMQVTLAEGENMAMHTPTRPNAKLVDFLQSQHRILARGASARYSSVTGDYNGTYSAQRQELVEGWRGYGELRQQFIAAAARPWYRRVVDAAVLAGEVSLRGIDPRTLYAVDIRGPAMPWIDPEKELNYRAGMVENELASRAQMIRDTGADPKVVDAQIADDDRANRSDQEDDSGEDRPAQRRPMAVIR